jgi:hypothetical protein
MSEFKSNVGDLDPVSADEQYLMDRIEMILDEAGDAKIANLPEDEKKIVSQERNRLIRRVGDMLDMTEQNRLNAIVSDTLLFIKRLPFSVRPLLRIFYNIVAPFAGLPIRGANLSIRDRDIIARMAIEGIIPSTMSYALGSRFIIGLLEAVGVNVAKVLAYNLLPAIYNKVFPEKTGDITEDSDAIEFHPSKSFPFVMGGDFNYNGPGTNY